NAALAAAFYRFGVWGIPLSTAIVNVVGTAALLYLLRRRVHRLEARQTAVATARIVGASAALAAASFGIWYALDDLLGRNFGAQIVSLGAAIAGGVATYVFFCRLLGVRELNALLSLRARPGSG